MADQGASVGANDLPSILSRVVETKAEYDIRLLAQQLGTNYRSLMYWLSRAITGPTSSAAHSLHGSAAAPDITAAPRTKARRVALAPFVPVDEGTRRSAVMRVSLLRYSRNFAGG